MDAYRERILEKVLKLKALSKRAGLARHDDIYEAYAHATYLYENEEVERALQIFQRLATEAPETPATWLALGSSQLRLGRLGEAHASLTACWMLNPHDPTPLYALGLVNRRQGKSVEAIGLFRHSLGLACRSPDYFDIEVKAAKQLEEY